MDGSLPTSLKHIISNAEYYGPSLFLLGKWSWYLIMASWNNLYVFYACKILLSTFIHCDYVSFSWWWTRERSEFSLKYPFFKCQIYHPYRLYCESFVLSSRVVHLAFYAVLNTASVIRYVSLFQWLVLNLGLENPIHWFSFSELNIKRASYSIELFLTVENAVWKLWVLCRTCLCNLTLALLWVLLLLKPHF